MIVRYLKLKFFLKICILFSIVFRVDALSSDIEKILQENKVPAGAILIVKQDKTLFETKWGTSLNGAPVNDQTIFSIQSISKLFTAIGVIKAVEMDLLDLNVPISKYIDIKINGIDKEQYPTLKMLLSHSSGLPFDATIGNNFGSNASFHQHIDSILQGVSLQFLPGIEKSYSNVGVEIAGYIIEKVSGMPFPTFMQQNVFTPLHMNRSYFNLVRYKKEPNKVFGTIEGFDKPIFNESILAAGGMYTCLADLKKFLSFMLSPAISNNSKLRQLIDKDMLQLAFPKPGQIAGYGLGV
jgi:CubicO group peptidase (beta-lactamase class C family)